MPPSPRNAPRAAQRAAPPGEGTRRARLLWVAALVGLLPLAALHACSVPAKSDEGAEPKACKESCVGTDASTDAPQGETSTVGPDATTEGGSRNSQCGSLSDCDPDLPNAVLSCASQNTGLKAVDVPTAGEMDGTDPLGKADIPKGNIPPISTGEVEAGVAPPKGAPPSSQRACHVKQGESGQVAYCTPTGTATDGAACKQSPDCAPGFACVRDTKNLVDTTSGHCRAYCCSIPGVCSPGLLCKSLKRVEGVPGKDDVVPVCLPADGCKLLEPGACKAGEACVITTGGLTTCDVPPSKEKKQTQPGCPCLEGYVCLQSINTCRKICHLNAPDECGLGQCVAGSADFPASFGVCSQDDEWF
jgi:hypothetical protein